MGEGGRDGVERSGVGGERTTQGPHLRRQSLSIPSSNPESRTSPHMLGQDRKRYGLFRSGGQGERKEGGQKGVAVEVVF